MRFTLRQLEVFLAVAQHESVSRAADDLAMSQSAVSGALADLERQFGIQLFERLGKRVQLSGLGRSLRPRAHALLEQAAELETGLSNESTVGLLRVGATLTIGNYLMVPEIARFMREHPGARVTLDVANTAEIVRQVLNFEIDIGLIEGERHEPELEVTRWRPDELVVFCAPNHGFAKTAVENSEVSKRRTSLEKRLTNVQRWKDAAGQRSLRRPDLPGRLRADRDPLLPLHPDRQKGG